MLVSGIVPANDFICLCCEIELAAGKCQTMRGMQSSQVDGRQCLAGDEINDGNRMQVAVGPAVVGDIGDFAVIGSDDLVRVGAGRQARQDL